MRVKASASDKKVHLLALISARQRAQEECAIAQYNVYWDVICNYHKKIETEWKKEQKATRKDDDVAFVV